MKGVEGLKIYVDKNALQDYTTKLIAKEKTIFATKDQVGSPLVASTVAEMTDHDKIYVYVGSETGYTSGNWYYWDGSAWVSGGIYNSEGFVLDDTLTSATLPAQAKAVGDKVNQLSEEIENVEGAAFVKQQMETTASATGWRLNESDGLSSSNSNYKLDKYLVNAGDILRIVSDDRFQFQNAASVPSTGSNNRVGDTYGAGSFLMEVPAGATYLIISTPVESSSGAFLMTPFTDKLADNETNIDFIEGSSVFSAESVYYPYESGDGRFSTNARMFWTEQVPKGSLVKRFKTYAATLGSSPILVVETWAVNGDTLTRIKAVSAKNLKANSEIEVEINSYSDKPQMVSYRTYNVNARHYRSNQPGHSWKYTTDISAETLTLSELSGYSNMILIGGFDYVTEAPSDFFSGCYNGNMVVFGDSTVDGTSTTGHTGNVIGTDRTAASEPNVFTSIMEGMLNTFTGGARRVYNAGFGGKTLNYIADHYSDIMAAFSNVKSALLVIDVNSASGTRAEYASSIRTGMERMINLLQQDGIAVAIASPQPMFYYPADDGTLPALNSAGEFAIAVNIGKDICKKYDLPFINLGELTNKVMESPYLKSSDFYGDRIHFGDGGHKFEAYELYGELIHPIIYYDGTDKLIGVESNRCELSEDSGISASTVGGYRSIVLTASNTRMDVLARFYIISNVPFKIKGVAVSGWTSYYDVFVDGTAYTSNTVEAGDEIPAGAHEITIKPTATEHIVRFSGIIVTK